MKIRRLSDALGAEVTGVDLAKLSNSLFTEINAAFLKHQVLCFRRQTLTAIKLIKFSECFGEVLPHDNLKFTLKSHPKILVLSNDVDKDGNQLGGQATQSPESLKEVDIIQKMGNRTILDHNNKIR